MIKSACIEMLFTEVTFEKRFELAKKSGFDYIEFWSWDDKDLDQIKELCRNNQLKITSFSGDKSFSLVNLNEKDQYIDYIKRSIEAAKFLECPNLVIHSNALGENGIVVNHYNDIPENERFVNMLMILKALQPIAEKNKITLVLEALNIHLDHIGNALAYTKEAAKLIELVNSSYIKILYDIYHMQIDEGNIIDNLKMHIDKIGYIHVADVPGRHEPGTGEINYANVFNALKSLKYNGVIGFELAPLRDSETAVKAIMDFKF